MEDGRFKCIFCGGDLCWNNDFDMSDVTGDDNDDGGIVSFYTCMHCERSYEISDQPKEERKTQYKDYWCK